jgi:hypothetical protein
MMAGCCKDLYARSSTIEPIVNHDTTSSYFSVSANGTMLSVSKYKDIQYASFQQGTAASIVIQCTEEIKDYTISPLSKNIGAKKNGSRAIQFSIDQPSYIVVKVNNKERLFLFAEHITKDPVGFASIAKYKVDATGREINTANIQRAIDETARNHQTLFFPSGIYKTGSLMIPSGSKIWFAPGALLMASDKLSDFKSKDGVRSKGFLNFLNTENVSINGYGIIDGNGRILRNTYDDSARIRLLFFNGCKNISIQDIIQRDPGSWNTQITNSEHISFQHVKLLNDVALANTDGFDPDASCFVDIENCFAYCGDDNVAIKITQNNPAAITSDITVRGCVFLTRKSSLKVGTESRGAVIKNILFENNDVVMSDRGMALYCSDGAVYENIRYINNRFEENYADAKQMGIHFSINKRNDKSKEGIMKNILIDSCCFYESFPKQSEIAGLNDSHTIDLTIRNLFIEGKKIMSLTDAGVRASFAKIKME